MTTTPRPHNTLSTTTISCPSCGGTNSADARVCAFCAMGLAPVANPAPTQAPPATRGSGSLTQPLSSMRGSGCVMLFTGSFFMTVALLMMVLASGMLISQWQRERREAAALNASGRAATAIVVDRRIDRDDDGPDDHYISYRYNATIRGDKRSFTREDKVSSADYNRMPPGTKIRIRYATAEPTIARPFGYMPDPNGLTQLGFFLGFNGFLLIFVLVGAGMLYAGLRSLRHANRLRNEGLQAMGTVVGLERDTDSDGDPTYAVSYRFTPQSGPAVQANQSIDKALFERLSRGDEVPVLYLPNDPKVAVLLLP